MEKPGDLTKAEREMIVVATSSLKCVVAHGAKGKLDFAVKVSTEAFKVDSPRSSACPTALPM